MSKDDPKLSEEQRKNLDAPITLDISLRGMSNSKMPGSDGLPV